MTSNLVKRQVLLSYRQYLNLGQIDHNLHNHVFDDVLCKPPIPELFHDVTIFLLLYLECQLIKRNSNLASGVIDNFSERF